MKKIGLLLLFITSLFTLHSQNSTPKIQCIRVSEEGRVIMIHSVLDEDEITGFTSYTYLSSDGGGYVEEAQITDINNGEYEYGTQVNGNSSAARLKLITRFVDGDGNDIEDETSARSIFVEVDNQTNTSVSFHWNAMGSELAGITHSDYKIYRRFKTSSEDWELVASLDNEELDYTHEFGQVCYDTLMIRVEMENDFGCNSVSNIIEIIVGDDESPEPPTVPYVTVDLATQTPTLYWTPSVSDDVRGYVICKGDPCIAIDTIWDGEANHYPCTSCDPLYINSLAVMAFDTCMNTSLKSEQHSNMFLAFQREACSVEINLYWTPYNNIPGGIKSYVIFGSQNGGEFSAYATLSPSETSYDITLNPIIEEYEFYIRAESLTGIISLSNLVVSRQQPGREVEYNEIRSVEVSNSNLAVDLHFFVDSRVKSDNYELYRASEGEEFEKIANIPYQGKDSFVYTDELPIVASKEVYRYYLLAMDECGLIPKQSNIVRTIKLEVDASDSEKNVLNWTDFSGWTYTLYDIYRYSESDAEPVLIGSSTSGDEGFVDNIIDLVSTSDRMHYYVMARESGTPIDGEEAYAKSSRGLVVKESLVWVPNTIIVTDIANNKFAPVCSFIRDGSYRFCVMNRAGTIMFESTKVNEAWDGKYKGKHLPPGVYVYYLEYVNSYGEKVRKGGTINYIN